MWTRSSIVYAQEPSQVERLADFSGIKAEASRSPCPPWPMRPRTRFAFRESPARDPFVETGPERHRLKGARRRRKAAGRDEWNVDAVPREE